MYCQKVTAYKTLRSYMMFSCWRCLSLE